MTRDFAPINLAIWSDPDFRALPADAKLLYFALWAHPSLSRAGVVDWRPGRIAALIDKSWTAQDVNVVADCLRARLFIVTDEQTEECLVRSWVRFDGLLKSPIMSVTFANEYAAIASDDLRGVVVHELRKIRELQPEIAAWSKSRVTDILAMPAQDPRDLPLPTDPMGPTQASTPALTPAVRVTGRVGGNPSANPCPTPSPSPTPSPYSPQAQRIDSVERESDAIADDFDEWWKAYPRKRGKGQAVRAYRAARKLASASELLKAIAEQTPNLTAKGDEFVPYPATWLNGQRWDDDLTTASNRPGGSPALPTYMQLGHPDYDPNLAALAGRS